MNHSEWSGTEMRGGFAELFPGSAETSHGSLFELLSNTEHAQIKDATPRPPSSQAKDCECVAAREQQ